MAIHPLAGQLAPESVLIDVSRSRAAPITPTAPTRPTRASALPSAPAATGARSLDHTFTESHILAITKAICDYRKMKGIDGPLFMGKDTHALSGPAQRTALEVLSARRCRDDPPARRRSDADPRHLARHPRLQFGPHHRRVRRDRDHSVAQPPRGRRLQVQPPPRRAPLIPMSPPGSKIAPTRCCARASPRSQARSLTRRHQGRHHPRSRLRRALRRRPGERHRHGGHPVCQLEARRRPPGRRGRPLLAAHCRPLRTGYHRHQSGDRSHVPVHDARPRRQDPHGLFQPLRDGQPGQAQGPLRRRLWQRSRFRPPWHCHEVDGPDESQPLPGRRDSLLAHPSRQMAAARQGRQNVGQQQPDRPRRQEPRSPSCRGARRLQMVRTRAAWTARSASAARKAPAPASCAATAPSGPPIRTARSSTCSPPRCSPAPEKIRASITRS